MRFGFPATNLSLVLCARCGAGLAPDGQSTKDYIVDGQTACAECGARYDICGGILQFLSHQKPLSSVTRDEQNARDATASRYDAHFSEWADALERSMILQALSCLPAGVVLDLACGTGRITTHVLSHAKSVLAVDLSQESLRILAQKAKGVQNLGLIWGDATQLRVRSDSVDVVVSTQLLEHIPTIDARRQFLEAVHNELKPSGVLLLTVYYFNILRRIVGKRQEGFHAGGIFYHRFTRSEIRTAAAGLFDILRLRPFQLDTRILPWKSNPGKKLESAFVSEFASHLLFVSARKSA